MFEIKKVFLMVFLIFSIALCCVACSGGKSGDWSNFDDENNGFIYKEHGNDKDYDDEDYDTKESNEDYSKFENKKSSSPKTVMDAFKGKERVWFKLHTGKLKYDTMVEAVIVTKNGKVTQYYSLPSSQAVDADTTVLKIEDFNGLNVDEIVEAVKDNNYFDITEDYTFYTGINEPEYKHTWKGVDSLPSKITYGGYLDDSGNKLKLQTIYFYEETNDNDRLYDMWEPSFRIGDFLPPTVIKDNEYVGFTHNSGDYLITINDFKSFCDSFDSVDGAEEAVS